MQNELKKELKRVAIELSELLTSYKFDESYAVAAALLQKVKAAEEQGLGNDTYVIVAGDLLRAYYKANDERNQTQKRMIAIGHKLRDIA